MSPKDVVALLALALALVMSCKPTTTTTPPVVTDPEIVIVVDGLSANDLELYLQSHHGQDSRFVRSSDLRLTAEGTPTIAGASYTQRVIAPSIPSRYLASEHPLSEAALCAQLETSTAVQIGFTLACMPDKPGSGSSLDAIHALFAALNDAPPKNMYFRVSDFSHALRSGSFTKAHAALERIDRAMSEILEFADDRGLRVRLIGTGGAQRLPVTAERARVSELIPAPRHAFAAGRYLYIDGKMDPPPFSRANDTLYIDEQGDAQAYDHDLRMYVPYSESELSLRSATGFDELEHYIRPDTTIVRTECSKSSCVIYMNDDDSESERYVVGPSLPRHLNFEVVYEHRAGDSEARAREPDLRQLSEGSVELRTPWLARWLGPESLVFTPTGSAQLTPEELGAIRSFADGLWATSFGLDDDAYELLSAAEGLTSREAELWRLLFLWWTASEAQQRDEWASALDAALGDLAYLETVPSLSLNWVPALKSVLNVVARDFPKATHDLSKLTPAQQALARSVLEFDYSACAATPAGAFDLGEVSAPPELLAYLGALRSRWDRRSLSTLIHALEKSSASWLRRRIMTDVVETFLLEPDTSYMTSVVGTMLVRDIAFDSHGRSDAKEVAERLLALQMVSAVQTEFTPALRDFPSSILEMMIEMQMAEGQPLGYILDPSSPALARHADKIHEIASVLIARDSAKASVYRDLVRLLELLTAEPRPLLDKASLPDVEHSIARQDAPWWHIYVVAGLYTHQYSATRDAWYADRAYKAISEAMIRDGLVGPAAREPRLRELATAYVGWAKGSLGADGLAKVVEQSSFALTSANRSGETELLFTFDLLAELWAMHHTGDFRRLPDALGRLNVALSIVDTDEPFGLVLEFLNALYSGNDYLIEGDIDGLLATQTFKDWSEHVSSMRQGVSLPWALLVETLHITLFEDELAREALRTGSYDEVVLRHANRNFARAVVDASPVKPHHTTAAWIVVLYGLAYYDKWPPMLDQLAARIDEPQVELMNLLIESDHRNDRHLTGMAGRIVELCPVLEPGVEIGLARNYALRGNEKAAFEHLARARAMVAERGFSNQRLSLAYQSPNYAGFLQLVGTVEVPTIDVFTAVSEHRPYSASIGYSTSVSVDFECCESDFEKMCVCGSSYSSDFEFGLSMTSVEPVAKTMGRTLAFELGLALAEGEYDIFDGALGELVDLWSRAPLTVSDPSVYLWLAELAFSRGVDPAVADALRARAFYEFSGLDVDALPSGFSLPCNGGPTGGAIKTLADLVACRGPQELNYFQIWPQVDTNRVQRSARASERAFYGRQSPWTKRPKIPHGHCEELLAGHRGPADGEHEACSSTVLEVAEFSSLSNHNEEGVERLAILASGDFDPQAEFLDQIGLGALDDQLFIYLLTFSSRLSEDEVLDELEGRAEVFERHGVPGVARLLRLIGAEYSFCHRGEKGGLTIAELTELHWRGWISAELMRDIKHAVYRNDLDATERVCSLF